MIAMLQKLFAAKRPATSRPTRQLTLGVESLEARENPSTFVPGTLEPAAAYVQYLNPGDTVFADLGLTFARDGNNTIKLNGTVMATGIKEFAFVHRPGGGDYFAELGYDGTMQWGHAYSIGPRTYGGIDYGDTANGVGWAQFQMDSNGGIDSLANNTFFAHWGGQGGVGFGHNATLMLGGVSKFEVARDSTLYTLQTNGSLAHWNAGGGFLYSQPGISNFAVDSYSQVVSVDWYGRVFVNRGLVGTDRLGTGTSGYMAGSHWLLGYDDAGNLTWNSWWNVDLNPTWNSWYNGPQPIGRC
jgi:hypothetical protein